MKNAKYFMDCTNLEELKTLYKKLAFKFHPDREGGDLAKMQEINDEYDVMHETLAMTFNSTDEGEKHPYNWKNDFFKEIISKIIHFDKMDIEIIGNWIWCFNSMEYHEKLKELGFWYSGPKKAWVYNGAKKKCRYKSRNTVDDLRQMWGSSKISTQKLYGINED